MSMLDADFMDNVINSREQEPQQEKVQLKKLGAYFERNADDVGTGKRLTCPLYIQEPDCAMLY